MSYQALYRKFRPQTFHDVKGQEHIVTTLRNQIKSGRIGHAYLFCGTRGTGKTTVAKIFAKLVNCENPGEDGPCGECAMCKAIQSGTSMNVVEIDAASNNRVDDIRTVIEEVQYSPSEGKYKVYIIDEVHMLSTSAFNALLKTLEEPPSYLIFILATTEMHKIPATILSRCQRYDFKRISVDTIAGRLKELLDKEGIEAEEKALNYIAKAADGAMRDGLSLLEQCVSFYFGETLTYENVLKILGAVDQTVYHNLLHAICVNSVSEVIRILDEVAMQGKDLTQFTSEFVWYLRNLLLVKTSEEAADMIDTSAENLEELKRLSTEVETQMIFRYIRVLSDVCNQLRYATQKRVLLEVTLIKLCRPEMENDYDSLVNRIHNLEKKIEEGNFAVLQNGIVSGNAMSGGIFGNANSSTGVEREAVKKELPKAIPEEVEEAAKNWNTIFRQLEPSDQAMMTGVKLSVTNDNKLLLMFPDEVAAGCFAESKEQLETLISNQTGRQVPIEIRGAKTRQEHDEIPELRDMFKINEKVEVEFID